MADYEATFGFEDVPSGSFREHFDKDLEILRLKEFKKKGRKTFVATLRFVGNVFPCGTHQVPLKTKRKGNVDVPILCPTFRPPSLDDPNSKAENNEADCPLHKTGFPYTVHGYSNVIVRELQKQGDENPVKVFRVPPGVAGKLKNLTLAVIDDVEDGERDLPDECDEDRPIRVNDPVSGFDIRVEYDPDAAGTAMYTLEARKFRPLTRKEKRYDYFDLWSIEKHRPDVETVLTDLASMPLNLKSDKAKKVNRRLLDELLDGKLSKGDDNNEDDDGDNDSGGSSSRKSNRNRKNHDHDPEDSDRESSSIDKRQYRRKLVKMTLNDLWDLSEDKGIDDCENIEDDELIDKLVELKFGSEFKSSKKPKRSNKRGGGLLKRRGNR